MKLTRRVLGHALVRLLERSHCSLICLLCTVCFSRGLRCAHSLAQSLAPKLMGNSFCLCDERVDFIQVIPTVQCAAPPSPPPVRHRCTLGRNGMNSMHRVLGHLLVCSLVRSHCSLICLLCTVCFTYALRCAPLRLLRSFAHSLAHSVHSQARGKVY